MADGWRLTAPDDGFFRSFRVLGGVAAGHRAAVVGINGYAAKCSIQRILRAALTARMPACVRQPLLCIQSITYTVQHNT